MHRILLVEDNVDLRESLQAFLEAQNFKVIAVGSSEQAEQYVESDAFDIGLIDINLPGRSGFELIADIRRNNTQIPLIALTARESVNDKVKGFETGLTDYVVKPFSLSELTARIKAHLRTIDTQHNDINTSPRLTLLPDRREVIYDDKQIQLTGTEYRLLEVLVRNNGKIVTTEDLITEGWGYADQVNDPPVRIHVRNLRKKLQDKDCTLIKSVAGTGYMLEDRNE